MRPHISCLSDRFSDLHNPLWALYKPLHPRALSTVSHFVPFDRDYVHSKEKMANPIDNVEDQLPEIEDQQLAMEKPFKCQFCEHRTKRRSSLETHVRCKHTFEEPYECDHCGMRFKVQSNLARHVRTHTGVKPHICAVCGKEYADKKNLDAHMEVEHEGRPQFECAYPGCGKRFARQDKFDHHRRHTNHNVPL